MIDEVREKKKLKRERIKQQTINVKKKEAEKILEDHKKENPEEAVQEDGEIDDEKNQRIIEKKLKALKKGKNKDQYLKKKREKEKEKKKNAETVIPKKNMRMLQNLKKGK